MKSKILMAKICSILILTALMLNSSLMLIVSEAVEAIQTSTDKEKETLKTQAVGELELTKYENFNTMNTESSLDTTGSKGVLVQYSLKTGITFDENAEYIPIKKTSINVDLLEIGDYKPSRVEVITKSTQATNGGKSAKYEYNASTSILTITAENKDYKDDVVDARDEYDIICIYKEGCYSATNEERDLKVRANVEVTLNDENSTKVLTKVEKVGKVTEKIGNLISAEYKTDDIYNGYIYANSINEENKYETLYKETAKIEISNKDIAQKYMMTWVNKFSNDTQELNDTTMVTYKETTIEKAKMIEALGEKTTLEILNKDGKVLQTITKDTEVDENGKIIVKYDNNTQNVFIRLTNVEKEGIVEFENTKCINYNMKDLAYNKINTYMVAQGYNLISSTNEDETVKTELKKVYSATELNTVQIKEAMSNIGITLDKNTFVNNVQNDVVMIANLKADDSKYSLFKNPVISI